MAKKSSVTKELERLKAENTMLKEDNRRLAKIKASNNSNNSKRNWKGVLRSVAVILLVAFSVALLTVGNIIFWTGNTVVKQDRFVAATEPIIKDTEVQQAMALYTTNSIYEAVDVQKTVTEVLPPRADFLAPQLANQLKGVTQKALETALAKPKLQDKWNEVSAKQHDRLITFAKNYTGDATISINEIYNQLDDNLKGTKLSFLADKKLPDKIGTYTVVNATWLPTFHKVVTKIDTWRFLTVILLALSLITAVWLSRNKRKVLYVFSSFAALLMVVSIIAIRVVRETVAGKVDPLYQQGVHNALDIFFHSFVIQTITIFLALTFLAVVTWISGSSRGALATKNQVALLFSGKLHSKIFSDENKFVVWVNNNKRILEWMIVAIIAALMLLTRLTLTGLFVYAFVMLALILLIEVVGGQSD